MSSHNNNKLLLSLIALFLLINLSNQITKQKAYKTNNFNKNDNIKILPTSFIEADNSINYRSNPEYTAEGQCTKNTCKAEFGSCKDSKTCECKPGYAQLPSNSGEKTNGRLCEYKLKKQLVAFLLEAFLVIGIGHFYCSRFIYGIIKLMFIFFVVSFDFIIKKLFKSNNAKIQRGYNIAIYVLYFLVIFWQVLDLVLFGLNIFKDGNDMPLWVN